jgi:uncharacterized protein (DUF1778 family)
MLNSFSGSKQSKRFVCWNLVGHFFHKKTLKSTGKCRTIWYKFLKGDLIMFAEKSHSADATGRRKGSRLEARISAEDKEFLKRAADLQGCSLTEFVVRSAQDAARKAVKEHQIMSLTTRDTEAFAKALLKPPAPSKKLKRAAERYKKVMGE